MVTDHIKAIIAVNSFFPFLALLAVSLRIYARRIRKLSFKADDYTIIAGLASITLPLHFLDTKLISSYAR